MFQYTLEKYTGSGTRYTCPACGKRKVFTRYIDTETGRYLADHVGRCDREANCGYHYKPKDYFADNPNLKNANGKNLTKPNFSARVRIGIKSTRKPEFIDKRHLIETLDNYDQNGLVHFLLGLFPFDPEDVNAALKEYFIGTKDGYTIFPYIDRAGRVCKGKALKFDRATGHRLREEYAVSSLQYLLKREGILKDDFQTDNQVMFGEHLLTKYPGWPVAIVESEKSAVIGSMCKRVFPDLVWIAAGSLSWLNAGKLRRVGRDRKIILFPDTDPDGIAYAKWRQIALDARKLGLKVEVSDLLEKSATGDQKADKLDLADYLISDQERRNDPELRKQFAEMINERLAILTIDGGLSEEEAETQIITSGYYERAVQNVLE